MIRSLLKEKVLVARMYLRMSFVSGLLHSMPKTRLECIALMLKVLLTESPLINYFLNVLLMDYVTKQ